MSKHFKSSSERNLKKSIITKTPSATNLQIKDSSSLMSFNIQCFGDKVARQYCTTPTCTAKSLLVCLDDECLCHHQHETCQLTSIAPTLRKIKAKVSDPTISLKQQINNKFETIIKSLLQCKQTLLLNIDNQKQTLKLNGLSEVQKLFLKIAQKNQSSELFSATQSHQLWKTINQKNHQNIDIFSYLKTKLIHFELYQKETINKFKQQTFDVKSSKIIKQKDLETTELWSSKSIDLLFSSYVFEKSLIIKDSSVSQRMIKLFDKKNVKSASLLYRASQNGFSLKQFFKTCGQQNNTLIIACTGDNKIIGGYSPLSHEFTGKGRKDFLGNEPVADGSKSSFIFSLSNNQRFDLIKSSYAIYRYKTRSFIQFGEGQLRISDNSNAQNSCQALINNGAYFNLNYKDNSDLVANNLRFNGGQSVAFSVKQWEVWKLQIE